MSILSPGEIVVLTEGIVIVVSIAIIWAVYQGSENAELPGEATIPEPGEVDDATPETSGRTLG